ncbi:aconitate hydratase AcnA [Gynuella sunshinyii]|uniref:Aconitate hydratase n=1 Tax=Gynuella sunshinyii YC6258 TaxID=1445510 RepID=A0A0C5V7Y3_9GAMM|nr:aconitate hydratase AcnA [Gynuella sunshinyii]AJQ95530.1 aconitase A [Gynuella sunshinyii YC6258]
MNPTTEEQWRKRYLTHLNKNDSENTFWSLAKLAQDFDFILSEQPFVVRLFLENIMRHAETEGVEFSQNLIKKLTTRSRTMDFEFQFYPGRILMQDYTGVPAIADLAAMRDAIFNAGGDAEKVNPMCQVDLVIDHSVIVDQAGSINAEHHNRQCEMERNRERYQFLKWAQISFSNLTVVPPGKGICHQINLEYLAQVVCEKGGLLYPDTLVGTDSHTTMINGLGVLGWGVGGIEAEAVMLGQPLSLNTPNVVGVQLEGNLCLGVTATDLVLSITEILRNHGVVGKYVEFTGSGISNLSVADRATIANMAPEYGATCALFPIDAKVIEYLTLTNRPASLIKRVYDYAVAQDLFYSTDHEAERAIYSENLTICLNDIVPSIAGPKRPQDRLPLAAIKHKTLEEIELAGRLAIKPDQQQPLVDGDLVIAAITSCTNTSNPQVMLLAGLLAKAAVEKGLTVSPHVKTSLAPGSQVVACYLDNSGLQNYLDQLGFHRIGFGCTTCIGNSGPLNGDLESVIELNNLQVSAVLSGNRNFEGRIHPSVRLNWLASPPLVVAFALAGHTRINFDQDPLGTDKEGNLVFLRDIWPDNTQLQEALLQINQTLYAESYKNILKGDEHWEALSVDSTVCFPWNAESTYIRMPPFVQLNTKPEPIIEAKILAILGDSITTDHISPAGQINPDSPAGKYLLEHRVKIDQFNSYGARRGNHEVMMRGTFANKRLINMMAAPIPGGFTRILNETQRELTQLKLPTPVSIYAASKYYKENNTPLVIFAGKEYGTGSSRDWAAKGCLLLNVKAVIAESFERIHRSNLVGMGIMPLQLLPEMSVDELELIGNESISIECNIDGESLIPDHLMIKIISSPSGQFSSPTTRSVSATLRIDNDRELKYFLANGILPYITKQLINTLK